jgi:hypothetical protein
MRKALNENPVVQVVMLGILGIVVAFLFMTRVMGGNDAGSDTTASPTATTPATTTPAPTDTQATTPEPATPPATEPEIAGSPGFEAGPGLPEDVVKAYEKGDVVALLVLQREGTEDRKLAAEIDAVSSRGDTAVFVVEADNVARYSRIAEGVDMDRVPALLVIEPKRNAAGQLPTATVSYGFRGPDSLEQTIRDALYEGKQLPYHPG